MNRFYAVKAEVRHYPEHPCINFSVQIHMHMSFDASVGLFFALHGNTDLLQQVELRLVKGNIFSSVLTMTTPIQEPRMRYKVPSWLYRSTVHGYCQFFFAISMGTDIDRSNDGKRG